MLKWPVGGMVLHFHTRLKVDITICSVLLPVRQTSTLQKFIYETLLVISQMFHFNKMGENNFCTGCFSELLLFVQDNCPKIVDNMGITYFNGLGA